MWVNPGEVPGDNIDNDGNGVIDDVHGRNAIRNSGDPMDEDGHGTHVAGIIGAVGGNDQGVAGVMWRTSLVALRALNALGGTLSDIIESVDYTVALKKRGVNIVAANYSLGTATYSAPFYDAIKKASDAGIVQITAAGNDGTDNDQIQHYPSNFKVPGLLSVAATYKGALDTYSNFGAQTVHIGAPGTEIYSTWPTASGSYATKKGTSMAAPHVTGAIGLMHSVASPLSAATATDALVSQGYLYSGSPLIGKTTSGRGLHIRNAILSVAPAQRIVKGCLKTAGSQPLSGINVTISDGSRVKSKTTGADGCFSLLASAGQYTLKPNKFAYSFTPSEYKVSVSTSDIVGRDFTGTQLPLYTVQGHVTSPYAGTNLAGVTVTISEGTTQLFTQTTDAQGAFTFTKVLPPGSYSLRAIRGVDILTPSLQSFTVSGDMTLPTITLAPVLPQITSQPADVRIGEGQQAVFSVSAVGTNLRYQWINAVSSSPIYGATSSSFMTPATSIFANNAQYSVHVSNEYGQITSSTARITIVPVITVQPADITALKGQAATFGIQASGSSLIYKWYLNGTLFRSCTNSSCYVPTDSLAPGNHTVSVDITNQVSNSVSSRTATLSVVQELPPQVLLSPSPAYGMAGESITFVAQVSGTSPTYVWKKNGTVVPSAAGSTLTLTGLKKADSGTSISVTATTAAGTSTASSTLTVTEIPPTIYSLSPLLPKLKVGQSVTFTTSATGSLITYAWYHKNAVVPGATGPSLTLPSVQLSDSWSTVKVVVSNSTGTSERSTQYTVEQLAPPSIVTHPKNVTVEEGASATFSVVSNGSQFLWYRNGQAIPEARDTSLTIPAAMLADNGSRFSVEVITADGRLMSQEATLTVTRLPLRVTKPLESQSVLAGEIARFSVQTNRIDTRYVWQKNGQVIPNAAAPTLDMVTTTADDGAIIKAIITDGAGASVSSEATLRVTPRVQNAQFSSFWVSSFTPREGDQVTFYGSTIGSPSKTQVLRNGVVIYTGALPFVRTMDRSDGGSYVARAWSGSSYADSYPVFVKVRRVVISISGLPSSIKTKAGRTITLKAKASASEGNNQLSFQWYRNGALIPRATQPSLKYKVSSKDRGTRLTVKVTAEGASAESSGTSLVLVK
jgi:subtilisin family serine protease